MGFFKGYTVQLQSLAIHYWFAIVHMYRTCATDTLTSNNGCQAYAYNLNENKQHGIICHLMK